MSTKEGGDDAYGISFVLGGLDAYVGRGNGLPAAAEELRSPARSVRSVITDQKAAKVEDRANHMVYVTEYDGAVYNGDGKPFLDKARYQVVALVDVGEIGGGYKTFTDADGSKVFAKFTVTEGKRPDIRGTFEFTGGTGRTKESPATELPT